MMRCLKVVCVLASVVCVILVAACEDDADTESTDTTTGDLVPPITTNTVGALYVLPSSTTVSTNAGDTVTFKAGGGTAPYTFNLSDGALGSLGAETQNPDGSVERKYTTSGGSGVNTMTVTDGAAATKQVTINHSS
jgi:hypothetical protein